MISPVNTVVYYLSQHPSIVGFRWSHAESWGSTWSFLFLSIANFLFLAAFLHIFLTVIIRRDKPVPLGPIPAVHSLLMSLISSVIFAGLLVSAAVEIGEIRWLWRRSNYTALEWVLCFPIGTRPSGRVFFWSYAFYLSRFVQMGRTFFTVLRRRKLALSQLLSNSIMTVMSFLWLEFSQSYQIVAILLTTLIYAVVYGYRFWTGIGLRGAKFPFVLKCQMVMVGCNVASHVGVLTLHFIKGGCNGIGMLDSVLNGAILLLFLNFYVRSHLLKKNKMKLLVNKELVNHVDKQL